MWRFATLWVISLQLLWAAGCDGEGPATPDGSLGGADAPERADAAAGETADAPADAPAGETTGETAGGPSCPRLTWTPDPTGFGEPQDNACDGDCPVEPCPVVTVEGLAVGVRLAAVLLCCFTEFDATLGEGADGRLDFDFSEGGEAVCACTCPNTFSFFFEVCAPGDYTLHLAHDGRPLGSIAFTVSGAAGPTVFGPPEGCGADRPDPAGCGDGGA